jgi:hypothetical protein
MRCALAPFCEMNFVIRNIVGKDAVQVSNSVKSRDDARVMRSFPTSSKRLT